LNNKVSESIYAITRAQSKKDTTESENVKSDSRNGIDHPGLVELIKRPSQSFELRQVSKTESDTIIKNNAYDYKIGNLICDVNGQVIYVKRDPRSTSALGATLRDLKHICMKYNIPEIVIIKNKRCASILNEIMNCPNEIKNLNLKVNVVNDVQNIDDLEMRQIILRLH
jgi:hypothetical protein